MSAGTIAWPHFKDVNAELFKALGHPARIQILHSLGEAGPLTAAQLKPLTGLESSNLSQHLAVLRRNSLITAFRRDGQVNYRLASPEVAGLMSAAQALLGSVVEANFARLKHAVAAQES